MTTLREIFIEALMTRLRQDDELQARGVHFRRSIFSAVDSEEPFVIAVHRGGDPLVDENIGRVTRECIVMVTGVRDPAPDQAADRLFERTHPLVMGFDAAGVLGVREIGTGEPEVADFDGGVGVVTMRYSIQYQTRPDSLS
jgi:hypothetical protein